MATYRDYTGWIYIVPDDRLDLVPSSYVSTIRCSTKTKKRGQRMKVLVKPKRGKCPGAK